MLCDFETLYDSLTTTEPDEASSSASTPTARHSPSIANDVNCRTQTCVWVFIGVTLNSVRKNFTRASSNRDNEIGRDSNTRKHGGRKTVCERTGVHCGAHDADQRTSQPRELQTSQTTQSARSSAAKNAVRACARVRTLLHAPARCRTSR